MKRSLVLMTLMIFLGSCGFSEDSETYTKRAYDYINFQNKCKSLKESFNFDYYETDVDSKFTKFRCELYKRFSEELYDYQFVDLDERSIFSVNNFIYFLRRTGKLNEDNTNTTTNN